MKRSYLFVGALLISIFLVACGAENQASDDGGKEPQQAIEFELVASEKNLPANFDELSFKRKETPYFQYFVKKVGSQSEFENAWDLYRFEHERSNVNFDEEALIFVGVQESGSCPDEIKAIEYNPENKAMSVSLLGADGACTSDATPRTFVIKIDQKASKEIESVSIVESGVETNVPFVQN